MPIVEYEAFEAYRVAGVLTGVFVGGCVDRGDGSSFRAKAHAHTTRFPNPGFICVRSAKRLYNAQGKPSLLMWHELAHLLVNQGHTAPWREAMRSLCGRLDKNSAALHCQRLAIARR